MKWKDESGVVVIESTYCILAAILVAFFFVAFGFFMYQATTVKIVANEVAEEIAQTYKLKGATSASDAVSTETIGEIGKYRYLFFESSLWSEVRIAKVEDNATQRLTQTRLATQEGSTTVTIKKVGDDVGRRHYEVTVEQRYSFLLGALLELLAGQDATNRLLSETARVESVDVLNYVNTVRTEQYLIGLINGTAVSQIGQNMGATVENLADIVKKLEGVFQG